MSVLSGTRRLTMSAVAAAALVTLSAPVAGATDTSQAARPVTAGTHYDRNASVVQDGVTTWMFFARSQTDPCNRISGSCNADNSNYDLYVEQSGNQGASWSAPQLVAANPSQPNQTPFRGRTPSATVDRSGTTWVFWASGGNSGPLYYTHNAGRGSTAWAPLQTLNDAAYFNVNAVTKGATTYVYYEDAGAAPGVYVRTFDGTTFGPAHLVAAGMNIPKAIVDRYGIFRMAMVDASGWPVVNVVTSSSLDGLHWLPPQVAVAGDGTVTNWDPALVQTADGIYRLFWAPQLDDATQRIESKTSWTFFDWWTPSTVVTSPSGYWDYWPTPTTLRGLSLFYTSEAGDPAGTGHIYQLTTTVPTHH